jgi:hypothetical protein
MSPLTLTLTLPTLTLTIPVTLSYRFFRTRLRIHIHIHVKSFEKHAQNADRLARWCASLSHPLPHPHRPQSPSPSGRERYRSHHKGLLPRSPSLRGSHRPRASHQNCIACGRGGWRSAAHPHGGGCAAAFARGMNVRASSAGGPVTASPYLMSAAIWSTLSSLCEMHREVKTIPTQCTHDATLPAPRPPSDRRDAF